MRASASTMILTLAALLWGMDWSAVPAQADEPGMALASDSDGDSDDAKPAAFQEPQPAPAESQGIRGLRPDVADVADGAADVAAQEQRQYGGCQHQESRLATVCDRFRDLGLGDARWSFTADTVALQRTNTRNQPLLENSDGDDLLNARHLNFPVEMGFQLGAVRHGPCGWDLELGYFQLDGWEANAFVPGESLMATDVHGENFVVENAQTRYTSAIHFGEINLRREWLDGLTLSAGFRMGELDELYSSHGTGAYVPVPVTLGVNTFNHLYGFQLGADYEFYNMGGPLRVSALCKSGIYANSASQRIRQVYTGFTDQTLEAKHNQAAFMGEAGLLATYQITKHWGFRASYSAVWLEGVALAPEQISVTDFTAGTADINMNGGVFYHGGGLGLELKF